MSATAEMNLKSSSEVSYIEDDVSKCSLVFVYGTLKREEPNHHWLTETERGSGMFVCSAVTVEKFPLVIASRYNIPYLLNAPGQGKNVEGELYEVDGKMLANLDVLEAHPKYYRREIRKFHPLSDSSPSPRTEASKTSSGKSEGEAREAWVYLLHTFKPAMLQLPALHSYASEGDHGLKYVSRYLRKDPGPEYWTDVKEA